MKEPGIDIIERYNIKVTWRQDIALVRQITAIRKICPELNKLQSAELLNSANNSKEFVFGDFYRWRAEEIVKEGKKFDLIIIIQN